LTVVRPSPTIGGSAGRGIVEGSPSLARGAWNPDAVLAEARIPPEGGALTPAAWTSSIRRLASAVAAHGRDLVVPSLVLWLLSAVAGIAILHPYDVTEYARYAHSALHAPLLHHLPAEYPAPALVVFLLPLLVPAPYPVGFAVVVLLVLVPFVLSVARLPIPLPDDRSTAAGARSGIGPTTPARRLLLYLALGTAPFLAGRYDLFVAAAIFWSVRAATRGRFAAAWTWSSVGVALKLAPAVLWPVLLVAEWRQRGRLPLRRLAWIAASALAVVGLPALLDPGHGLDVLRYYLHRPVEIGSIPAGLSVLAQPLASHWFETFHSVNVVNASATALAALASGAAGAAEVVVVVAFVRRRLPIPAACLAMLSIAVLGSKVLSVQYLLWLMPLWALYETRPSWTLAALVNTAVFAYAAYVLVFQIESSRTFALSLTFAYLARDLLVTAGTARWLAGELRASASEHRQHVLPAVVPVVPAGGLQVVRTADEPVP